MYIAADIGSSFVKLALIDDSIITATEKRRTARIDTGKPWEYEYDADGAVSFIREYTDRAVGNGIKIDGILLSTQMHGFILARGERYTDYISWQDERSLVPCGDGRSTIDLLRERLPAGMLARGGVRLKCELSVCGAAAFFRQCGDDPGEYRFYTLGSYIISRLTGKNITHITNAAPTGMYDIFSKCWNSGLISLAGLSGMSLPEVTDGMPVCGYYNGIPVYPDIGDHQATVLGSGIEEGVLSINAGTASQMAMICGAAAAPGEKSEIRPFFGGKYIRVVSKLPGGRSLQVIADFFADTVQSFTGSRPVCADIWRYLDSASPSEATDLEVSLGFYRSLLFPGGGITGITPSNLTPENIIRAAYTDMARSFLRVLPEFGDTPAERIAVSGKFAPVLIAVLKRISPEKREYIPVPECEAVFRGLKRLLPRDTSAAAMLRTV